ncbi:hypothetical protein [Sphingobacterium sp.]
MIPAINYDEPELKHVAGGGRYISEEVSMALLEQVSSGQFYTATKKE